MMDYSASSLGIYNTLKIRYETLARSSLEPTEFWQNLGSLTTIATQHTVRVLHEGIPGIDQMPQAVVCTGSDSRLEKCGLLSPVECILISPGDLGPHDELPYRIVQLFQKEQNLIYPRLERKILAKDALATYEKEGGGGVVIPTRAFDAVFLAGSYSTFLIYKRMFVDEIIQNKVQLRLFEQKFLKEALQNIRAELSEAPRKQPLASLSTGQVFYDKVRGRGLKHDLLRAVQYATALLIFKKIQEGRIDGDFALQMPKTVLGRIEWLWKEGLTTLSSEEYQELQRLYTQISYWYVALNVLAVSEVDPCITIATMSLPKEALKNALERIHELVKHII
jgi:hypothetical protein